MALVLGLLGLYYAFRPKAGPGFERSDLFTAMLFLDVYWVTQACAFLVPGTHWCDEGFCFEAPFAPQLAVEGVGITLNALAYGFGSRAVGAYGGKKGV